MKTSLSTPAFLVLLTTMIVGCSSVKFLSKNELTSGNYQVRPEGGHFYRVRVEVDGDSMAVYRRDHTPMVLTPGLREHYIQNNLDFDVVFAPFKYRPATSTLPRQLTTSYNAQLFAGYRLDSFRVRMERTKEGHSRTIKHRSIGIGLFGGVSSEVIGPWTTNYQTMDEYSGLGISRGIMLLGGIESITFGLAFGIDRLTDRDKHIWIYQNKPWYGLTIGLNIN